MTEKVVRVTVALPISLHRKFKTVAAKNAESMDTILRRAVDEYASGSIRMTLSPEERAHEKR